MRVRTVLLVVVLAVILAFAALNWNAFTTPTSLSLAVTMIQAPIGAIMLALTGLLTLVFLVFVVSLQASVLLESRRNAKELKAQRELADQAEASRFTELRGFIAAELIELGERINESHALVLERVNKVESDLQLSLEQSSNTVAAYLGELEDRLDREISGRQVSRPS